MFGVIKRKGNQFSPFKRYRAFHTMKSSSDIVRITGLRGWQDRRNDVLFGSRLEPGPESSVVVYFGGDIQDFEENMTKYKKWSLEKIAALLLKKFPQSYILVVRPNRFNDSFSCYDNFVRSNQIGVPSFSPYYNALSHLRLLLKSIGRYHYIQNMNIPKADLTAISSEYRLKLIGFSKGCVVLNQFVQEFHHLKNHSSPEDSAVVSRIEDMYFLDAGHGGSSNIWVTDAELLLNLASLGIKIHVHVTPYQVQCPRRRWIGEEEKIFTKILQDYRANLIRCIHFEDKPPTIDYHFELLNVFP